MIQVVHCPSQNHGPSQVTLAVIFTVPVTHCPCSALVTLALRAPQAGSVGALASPSRQPEAAAPCAGVMSPANHVPPYAIQKLF